VNRVWDLSQELSLILESIFYQLQVLGQLINSRKIRVIVLGLLRVVKIRIGVKGLVVGLMVYILISAQGWG
jgi:ABC-type tungstate transport system substrate-binding protein